MVLLLEILCLQGLQKMVKCDLIRLEHLDSWQTFCVWGLWQTFCALVQQYLMHFRVGCSGPTMSKCTPVVGKTYCTSWGSSQRHLGNVLRVPATRGMALLQATALGAWVKHTATPLVRGRWNRQMGNTLKGKLWQRIWSVNMGQVWPHSKQI